MNKSLLVIALLLSATVGLLSVTVFYLIQDQQPGQFNPCCNTDNRMNARMPYPPGQETMPKNMAPLPNTGRQSEMAPPGGPPNFMGGQNMGGAPQQGQPPPGGQNMGGAKQGPGQSSGPGLGGQQGPSQQFGQQAMPNQGQSGSREQVSKIMQEAMQEAQTYFMSQNRKPEHQEMLTKVQALMTQKMNAQGISQDVQQKVLSGMNQASPPQPPQQRP